MSASRSARALLAIALVAAVPVPARAGTAAHVVEMLDSEFQPPSVTVYVETSRAERRVRWINVGALDHTATRNGVYGWDSGLVGSGDSYTKLFKFAGLFAYDCTLHGGMRGSVKVKPWAGSDGSRTVDVGETARVRVGATDAPDGLVFDIQKKVGDGTWERWRWGWTNETARFTPHSGATRYFRARLRNPSNGNTSDWSPRTRLNVV